MPTPRDTSPFMVTTWLDSRTMFGVMSASLNSWRMSCLRKEPSFNMMISEEEMSSKVRESSSAKGLVSGTQATIWFFDMGRS